MLLELCHFCRAAFGNPLELTYTTFIVLYELTSTAFVVLLLLT
jgi:hypothetical protein